VSGSIPELPVTHLARQVFDSAVSHFLRDVIFGVQIGVRRREKWSYPKIQTKSPEAYPNSLTEVAVRRSEPQSRPFKLYGDGPAAGVQELMDHLLPSDSIPSVACGKAMTRLGALSAAR
jgi:hypothetical protein